MVGYWLFLRVLDRDEVEFFKHAKKEEAKSSHLDRSSLVNTGFIIWDKTPTHDLNFPCGTNPVSRAGKIAPSSCF